MRTQVSQRVLLVHLAAELARHRRPDLFREAGLAEGLRTLAAAHRRAPEAVGKVLLHPQINVWALRCLRRLVATDGREDALADDLGYFGAMVAAAALRAGMPFETMVRVRGGRIAIPGEGTVLLTGEATWARISGAGGVLHATGNGARVRIELDRGPFTAWLPVRRLASGAEELRAEVLLDDLDWYRHIDGALPPAGRVPPAEVGRWQALLDEAWFLLARHPRRAAALAVGLRSVVPLVADRAGHEVSATSTDMPGAVALSRPRSGLRLAATLVHEFQHSVLAGMMDAVPLYEPAPPETPEELYYAPWRPDPRPLGALLQGTYAYLGLVHFWGVERTAQTGPASHAAHLEFALWRGHVRRAIGTLRQSGRLTPRGHDFAHGMASGLDRPLRAPVPALALDCAREIRIGQWIGWRLANTRPPPPAVEAWAQRWPAGRPGWPSWRAKGSVRPAPGLPSRDPDRGLVAARLHDPRAFERLCRDPDALAAAVPGATAADAARGRGDHQAAIDAYRVQVRRDPDDPAGWIGLALSAAALGRPAARVLLTRPEAVLALLLRVDGGDPLGLAEWLAG